MWQSLLVGGRLPDGDVEPLDGMHGSVAEVRLWSGGRSADELRASAGRAGVTGQEDGLVGWWRVDEGGGHEVHDGRWGQAGRQAGGPLLLEQRAKGRQS